MSEVKKKILVAEDEKPMAKALELKLTHAFPDKVEVKVVYNGEEAISVIPEGFDLIFLDLVMPKFDGFQVLEYMKSKNLNIPCIVLSNLGQEEDVKRAKSLGAIDYFIKSDTPITNIVSLAQGILSL